MEKRVREREDEIRIKVITTLDEREEIKCIASARGVAEVLVCITVNTVQLATVSQQDGVVGDAGRRTSSRTAGERDQEENTLRDREKEQERKSVRDSPLVTDVGAGSERVYVRICIYNICTYNICTYNIYIYIYIYVYIRKTRMKEAGGGWKR